MRALLGPVMLVVVVVVRAGRTGPVIQVQTALVPRLQERAVVVMPVQAAQRALLPVQLIQPVA